MVGVPLTVTPVGRFRVGASRLDPTMSTDTLVPCTPMLGVMLVSTGAGGLMVTGSVLLVPPVVVTLMVFAPVAALAAIARVAVIWVAVIVGVPVTVTPAGRFRVEPSRLVPVMVTAGLVPCTQM